MKNYSILNSNYEVVYINIQKHWLNEFIIPTNLIQLNCYDNNIKDLRLNNKLKWLNCDIFVSLYNIDNKELRVYFG